MDIKKIMTDGLFTMNDKLAQSANEHNKIGSSGK